MRSEEGSQASRLRKDGQRQSGDRWERYEGALIEGVIIQKCKVFLLDFCFIRQNKLDGSRIMSESVNVHRYMNRCREKATKFSPITHFYYIIAPNSSLNYIQGKIVVERLNVSLSANYMTLFCRK